MTDTLRQELNQLEKDLVGVRVHLGDWRCMEPSSYQRLLREQTILRSRIGTINERLRKARRSNGA